MTIHAIEKNMTITSLVVAYKDRTAGSESKLNTYSDGIKVLKTIFYLYKNNKPLSFFGLIAICIFILAIAFFIPILIEYIKTGLVPNFPTLIVCGFAVVTSIISLFVGLILQSITKKEKADFEFKLQIVNIEYKRMLGTYGE